MTPPEVLAHYDAHGLKYVFWERAGDLKGPTEHGWPQRHAKATDWHDNLRVGLLTGVEISPGRFLHDVDIDWAPGAAIASRLLPATGLEFGRQSKRLSHRFYTADVALRSLRFEDTDKTCLLELRGVKADGTVGFQTMVPPSIWSKNGTSESLTYASLGLPAHLPQDIIITAVRYAAVACLLAKHLGVNGFGHEPRLAWAGFMLRLGVSAEDAILIGEAISIHCNNKEVHDVRRAVESSAQALATDGKKVKGGPTLVKLLGRQVVERASLWLGKEADFIRDKAGRPIGDDIRNIDRTLALLGHEFAYDEFAMTPMMNGVALSGDTLLTSMRFHAEREWHIKISKDTFNDVVLEHCARTPVHPVRHYLRSLTWDGMPRLDEWLIRAAGAEDTEYTRAVSSIALLAAGTRIFHPGCKYDEMLVLEGNQGVGKSSGVQTLCPDPKWFSDDLPLNSDSKVIVERTAGKWLIEASDMAGKKKTEIEALKAMMSRQVDVARLAYARLPVQVPRHWIIFGTSNKLVLSDPTGARRFWGVKVPRQFDVAWLVSVRDQLWAEVVARVDKGASIRLPERLWPHATAEQDKRREVDEWEDVVKATLLSLPPSGDGQVRVGRSELLKALGVPLERRDRLVGQRLNDIMDRLGFVGVTVRVENAAERGYRGSTVDFAEDAADLAELTSSDVPF